MSDERRERLQELIGYSLEVLGSGCSGPSLVRKLSPILPELNDLARKLGFWRGPLTWWIPVCGESQYTDLRPLVISEVKDRCQRSAPPGSGSTVECDLVYLRLLLIPPRRYNYGSMRGSFTEICRSIGAETYPVCIGPGWAAEDPAPRIGRSGEMLDSPGCQDALQFEVRATYTPPVRRHADTPIARSPEGLIVGLEAGMVREIAEEIREEMRHVGRGPVVLHLEDGRSTKLECGGKRWVSKVGRNTRSVGLDTSKSFSLFEHSRLNCVSSVLEAWQDAIDCLGQEHTEPASQQATGTPAPAAKPKRRKRPGPQPTKEKADQDQQLSEAWESCRYKCKDEVDAAFGLPQGTTYAAYDRYRKRKKRDSKN